MSAPPVFNAAALAYFKARGIDPQLAARLGVREDRGELVWPCPDAEGRPAPRRRSLNGGGAKVRGARGASTGLWWPSGPPPPGRAVLLCEGESDALAALTALELDQADPDGAVRFAREYVGAVASMPGTSFPRPRLAEALRKVGAREVLVALDADQAGDRAATEVGRALREAGMHPRRLRLPEGEDLAGCLASEPSPAAWLIERVADASMDAEPSAERGAELAGDRYAGRRYDLGQLVREADREPPWRVEPIAADGHLTLLSAHGGEGKTWLGLTFAGAVANGATVAGLRCSAGRAVIFDAENGAYVLGSRLGALDPGLPADRVAVYDAEGLRLDEARDRGWMLEVIRREGANLAVLDSLRALAPDAAENDSDDMAPIVTGAKTIARQSGAAIVLLIHRGHGAADFRGSTAIRDAADLLFVLEREPNDPERRWRRRLRCAKCRIAEEPEERWLGVRSWHGQVTLEEAEPFEPGVTARDPEDVADDLAERVLATIAEHHPRSRNALTKLVRGRRENILAALRAHEEAGTVRPTPEGYEVVPERREPPGNHPSEALGGGGSRAGGRPEGPPPWEPPRAFPDDGGSADPEPPGEDGQ